MADKSSVLRVAVSKRLDATLTKHKHWHCRLQGDTLAASSHSLIVAEYAICCRLARATCKTSRCSRKLATFSRPILLKRGPSATIKEWLLAAEYLLAGGNANVVLCERGIKTFETATRNTLDLSAIALAKELSHLPVVADPSHGTVCVVLVPPMSKAAAAVGADGLIIEVHPCPERALSDGTAVIGSSGIRNS